MEENKLQKLSDMVVLTRVHIAITALDTAHLHEMHVQISKGEIDPHTTDRLRKLVTLIDNTPWWKELEVKAKQLRSKIVDLSNAVAKNEPDLNSKAGEVHGLYHSLVRDFYDLLPTKQ